MYYFVFSTKFEKQTGSLDVHFLSVCKNQEKDGEKPNQVLPLSESPYSVAGRKHCLAACVACVISVVSLG